MAQFLYQPHIHTADGVLTPDIGIEHLSYIVVGSGNRRGPLGINLMASATHVQQIGANACGSAALVLVAAGRGAIATLGSCHWDQALNADENGMAEQVCPKPLAREGVRLDQALPDLPSAMLRTWRLSQGRRTLTGETQLGALEGAMEIARACSTGSFPRGAAIILSPRHEDPGSSNADGYEVEISNLTGVGTITLTYSVEKLVVDPTS